MIILGIESSCDDSGLALYDTHIKNLRSHVICSQNLVHKEYGGVVPELAARTHIQTIIPLLSKLLKNSNLELKKIDIIAYTRGPGLPGSLLVGSSIACSIALSINKPVIGINHLEGHLLSPFLSNNSLTFPFIALLVSGGHTQLIKVNSIGNYFLLGETLDDAAGDTFDKIAKMLDLGYPGGPEISLISEFGDPNIYKFPRPMLYTNNFNFSFSGLKTSVLNVIKNIKLDSLKKEKANIARGFLDAIIDVLTFKCIAALKNTGINKLVVVGGVGANKQLRKKLNILKKQYNYTVFYPKKEFCTDNGAMIAFAGAMRIENNYKSESNYEFNIKPQWKINKI
ncbi:tRNA (adenosine(37)-N6)-threonylcarbamoyltransferase complex transferase subunit TsaD [Candidatus Profftella armatura]|uniref:N(6)-L-threonylcarbamoyladenine synthase n=2 Tax=cellular organisms TaxID=131567 RepID=A0A1S4EN10_DIACI|nr:tRNA (adenosine(37)-N6)-threonylcarbamoyltransferase complex transferase subunit TsaD [Candidatus Profftella armatura]XP_017303467.1 uncharacterized protein LOC108253636 [Diaphorina citri]AGS06997.1 O-sialoglycoprotein endopeptidase [Candidatus Profftella armatura]ALC96060.1 UGMP family protein [Candidatus Profftella armatura]QLK13893.1 tRNA (adenosine(37)-N6)-threonylcarbamoyltransferase complex transferase subunit TsaD [Candidatus Profftella armatura]